MQKNELKFPGINVRIERPKEVQLEILLEVDAVM